MLFKKSTVLSMGLIKGRSSGKGQSKKGKQNKDTLFMTRTRLPLTTFRNKNKINKHNNKNKHKNSATSYTPVEIILKI